MKYTVVLLGFLSISFSGFSDTPGLLNKLDKALAKKDSFTNSKLTKIETLKDRLRVGGDVVLIFNQYLEIFNEYKTLNFDSAYAYQKKAYNTAIKLNDTSKINRSKIDLAFILLSSGMFIETKEVIDDIEISSLDQKSKIEYYGLKARYYYDLCDFVKDKSYCDSYLNSGNQYADLAINLSTFGSYDYFFNSGLKNLQQGNLQRGISDYKSIINTPGLDGHQYAILASTLSYMLYSTGQKSEGFNFLIRAAIADIEYSTKENIALFKLADTLFHAGDNERAYHYMQEAMADAEFYGARHRQLRVGTMLPVIMGKQLALVEEKNSLIYKYALSVTVLSLLIVAFIVIIFIQLKKLKAAEQSLSAANAALLHTNKTITETNTALRDANRIKDEYIGYYFNINSEYIDKIERFKTSISQKLEMGRYDDIKKSIYKIDLKKEREDLSQSFDRVFIKLFPDFVKEFNSYFKDEDRIELPPDVLLNTELRIFALIRLGIHDNDRIAKILDYSVNTIYSYKTRIKNKSFVPNDEFEDKIMAIKAH